MEKGKVMIVLKGVISYLMNFRPYMTAWVSIYVIGAIVEGIRIGSIGTFAVLLVFAALPAMVKRFLLAVSRIGGRNRYDEKNFGRGPQGRMTQYLAEYVEKKESIRFDRNEKQ